MRHDLLEYYTYENVRMNFIHADKVRESKKMVHHLCDSIRKQ